MPEAPFPFINLPYTTRDGQHRTRAIDRSVIVEYEVFMQNPQRTIIKKVDGSKLVVDVSVQQLAKLLAA